LALFGNLLVIAFSVWNLKLSDFKSGCLNTRMKYLLELGKKYEALGSQNSVGFPGGVKTHTTLFTGTLC
jgi:hypothetical protein